MVICRCSVLMLSTTTRFFLLLVKLMSQFRICGLISTSPSLRTKILWDTESNALLKSIEEIHTKSAFPSIFLSQLGRDFCDAMLELSPFRWANESRSMWLVHTVDTSFLYTSHSNRRKIIFVREIGLCWFRELSSISLAGGLIFASFHENGTVLLQKGGIGTQSHERASREYHQGPRQSF